MYDKNTNNNNDISSKRKSWSKAIAMHGTLHDKPAIFLFDSGAEGIFINELLIKRYNIDTQHDSFGRVGIMADGTEQFIDRVINNVKINIQGYNDEINMHVMPLSQYDVILGVPWHEAVNAVTYHQQRMIIISQKNDDNEINKIILKQQKRDRRM